jgi:hypothetical protein
MNSDTAITVLEECEKGLRQAAAAALTEGNYGQARQIMAWAENVASMAMVARSTSAAEKAAGGGGAGAMRALEAGSEAHDGAGRTEEGEARLLSDEYPRFMRRGDELVKVGWSKSDGTEYQHRAPRRAVDAVVNKLNALAYRGEAFASEKISPLKDSVTGTIFPTYQIFVALGWLRKLGLVKQEGRKSGYTVRKDVSLPEEVAQAWEMLAAG